MPIRIGLHWLALAAFALLALVAHARAATINVGCAPGTDDVAALIAAINTANDETTHPGLDTITLGAGCTYTMIAVDNWWYRPNGLPAISSTITIEGNGATITRSGNDGTETSSPNSRFFYISCGLSGLAAGTLTLHDLTLSNGIAKGGDTQFGGGGAAWAAPRRARPRLPAHLGFGTRYRRL